MSSDPKIDDLCELATRVIAEMDAVDPVLTHHERHIATGLPIAILMAGCLHLGGRWTFIDKIKGVIDELLSHDRVYLGLFGDEIEHFVPGSFVGARSVMEQALQPPLQIELWKRFFRIVAPKTLWGTASQHGTMWAEKRGLNPIKDTYLDCHVPFFDGQGYVRLVVGDESYHIAVAHEFPGSSMYNPVHSQRRALWQRYPMADVIAQADRHQYAVQELMVYGNEVEFGNRSSPFVWLIQIGTAKGGPDPYTIRGWEKGQTEWPWLVLWPDRHQVKVTRDIQDVYHWLDGVAPDE